MSILEQIQSLVRQFRNELKAENEPSIRSFLDRIDSTGRRNLFENLLLCELEYLRRKQRSVTSEDYISRFPEFRSIVRQAFFESTMMSQDAELRTPDSAEETMTVGQPMTRQLGQYELIRELGRGGFGVVYEARHISRGDRVALKTLPTMQDGQSLSSRDADRLHRFRREFRSLAEVNHPNLVGMQTLEVDHERWFFTMDLIDGVDFLEYVRPNDQLDADRLQRVLPQLVRGIIALHQMGIVHRDLKPSNVLVNRDGQLVILDFGLVAELQQFAGETLSMGTKQFAGTPRYAAPEQIAGERTAAVDWYALGSMLFEAITGKSPIAGSGFEVMVKKQTENPEPLENNAHVPTVLSSLGSLIDQMLRLDPESRPTDSQVLERLQLTEELTQYEYGSREGTKADSRSNDSEDTNQDESGVFSERFESGLLIGRESHLAKMEQLFRSFSQTGEPHVLLISGRSGEGKTTLANAFLKKLEQSGNCVIFAGRCYDREAVPFKAIDCWIDSFVSHLRTYASSDLRNWLPKETPMLVQLFPLLRRVSSLAEHSALNLAGYDNWQLRNLGFAALRALLLKIANVRPIVLFMDDLQWGDADSAVALRDLLRSPEAPAVFVVGSYRSDEASNSAFLKQWNRDHSTDGLEERCLEVAVSPLSEAECWQLVESRLGSDSSRFYDRKEDLFKSVQGNPYFLEQLIDAFDQETGTLEQIPLREILLRKLSRLPKDAQNLLEVIAVAGQAVRVDDISEVEQVVSTAYGLLTHMRSEKLVRLISQGAETQVDTYHDKVRETVLDWLDTERRRDLHRRFAERLIQSSGLTAELVERELEKITRLEERVDITDDNLYVIAMHLLGANDPRAKSFQMLAGICSLQSYATDEAYRYFREAEKLFTAEDGASRRYQLFLALGRTCLYLKKLADAYAYYEEALKWARADLELAEAQLGLGAVMKNRSEIGLSISHYDRALEHLARPRSRGGIRNVGQFATNSLLLVFHFQKVRGHKGEQVRQREELEYRILNDLGLILMDRDLLGLAACTSRSSRLRATLGADSDISLAYALLSFSCSAIGLFWLGRYFQHLAARYLESSAVGDEYVTGTYFHYLGGYFFWTGSLQRSRVDLVRSSAILAKIGMHYEMIYGPHMLRHIAYYVSSTEDELHWAKQTFQAAEQLGSEQQVCWGTYDVAAAYARSGNLESAREWMSRALQLLKKEPYTMTESIRGGTLGFVCLQCSDYTTASQLAIAAVENAVRNKNLSMDVTSLSMPVSIESIVGPNWREQREFSREERKNIAKLRFWTWLLYRFLPNHQTHLLRVWGRYYYSRGRKRKARRLFAKAIRVGRARGMQYPLGRALLDAAVVDEMNNQQYRQEAIEIFRETKSVIPYAERWQLGDQQDSSVVAPAS